MDIPIKQAGNVPISPKTWTITGRVPSMVSCTKGIQIHRIKTKPTSTNIVHNSLLIVIICHKLIVEWSSLNFWRGKHGDPKSAMLCLLLFGHIFPHHGLLQKKSVKKTKHNTFDKNPYKHQGNTPHSQVFYRHLTRRLSCGHHQAVLFWKKNQDLAGCVGWFITIYHHC